METISLEQTYYIGELITTFAVVVSLIYVGIQVKQNTCATRSIARQSVTGSNLEWFGVAIDSKTLATAILKDSNDTPLDEHEELALRFWHIMRWRTLENAYYQYRNGLLDAGEWNGYERVIRYMPKRDKLSVATWKKVSDVFSPAFNSEIQRIWDTT